MRDAANKFTGLIMCGGSSTRMGTDKCLLLYRDKPQCYHLHDLLQGFCDSVFLSCSLRQAGIIEKKYPVMPDLPGYGGHGPVAGLLTAFHHFPGRDFLIVGCDYPLLSEKELSDFIQKSKRAGLATAFYNQDAGLYEPMLAWYSHRAAATLRDRFEQGLYSLQQFLQQVDAEKYEPKHPSVMVSIDTPASSKLTKSIIEKLKRHDEK